MDSTWFIVRERQLFLRSLGCLIAHDLEWSNRPSDSS